MTKIFLQKNSINFFSNNHNHGFTLIELLVVVCIMVFGTLFIVPSLSSYFKLSLQSAAQDISSLTRQSYNSSLLTGTVHRIVFDFQSQSFWIEKSTQTEEFLLDTHDSLEKQEKQKQFGFQPESSSFLPFTPDSLHQKKKLPLGVTFQDILTSSLKEPVTQGRAMTHFFPNGMIEKTLIHMKDQSQHQISIIFSPFVGKTEIFDRYVPIQEIFK